MKRTLPGSYQRLDLFIKVLRVLCPNLTDASKRRKKKQTVVGSVFNLDRPSGTFLVIAAYSCVS